MRTITILGPLVLVAVLSAQESAPATRPQPRLLTRAEMTSDLGLLDAAIHEKWSYLEDKEKNFGVDLRVLVARAKEQIPETGTKAQFHAIVLELVAGLKDGHAAVFTLGVAQPSRRWPFTVADVAEGSIVVRTGPHSLTLGDRVLQIDGTPIEDLISLERKKTIASTDAARRALAIKHLAWSPSPIVTAGRNTREPGFAEVSWVTVETLDSEPPALRLESEGPLWSVDRPAAGVARLRVRSFAVENWTAWLAAKPESRDGILAETRARIDACFREIGGSKALILDFRGNEGGTDLLGIHLAKHLLPKRFVYYMLSSKTDGKWSKPHGYEHDPVPPDQRFDGPLAILIDEECFSTTDNCLRAIIENRSDAIVVGRPTNGGTGAPAVIAKLPASETSVTLCTMRVYGPLGNLIEGRGTVPTIAVRWTAADYLQGRDPDVAAALEALGRK